MFAQVKGAIGGLVLLGLGAGRALSADAVLFEETFESRAPGALSKDFLVLAGGFSVVEENGARFLELPGAPLDTFGALFGPSSAEPCVLEGRIFGTKQGRKFPVFGLSLRGAGGYRLQCTPAKGQLELFKGDTLLAAAPFAWESGTWTQFRLILSRENAGWLIQGYAWKEGQSAPDIPQIRHAVEQEIPAGRAAIWGSPYAGTPIRFDDLRWTAKSR